MTTPKNEPLTCVLRIDEPGRSPRKVTATTGSQFGRSRRNTVVLEDKALSSRHFQIVADSSGLAIEDLGSSNGTQLENGTVLHRGDRAPLRAGLRFLVGNTTVLVLSAPHEGAEEESTRPDFEVPRASVPAPPSPEPLPVEERTLRESEIVDTVERRGRKDASDSSDSPTGRASGYVLRITYPEGSPQDVPIAAGMTFGRVPSNSVQLEDPTASSRHFRLVDDAGGLAVEDLGSTNGTRLDNGEVLAKGQRHALRVGMSFAAGNTLFMVLASTPTQGGPPRDEEEHAQPPSGHTETAGADEQTLRESDIVRKSEHEAIAGIDDDELTLRESGISRVRSPRGETSAETGEEDATRRDSGLAAHAALKVEPADKPTPTGPPTRPSPPPRVQPIGAISTPPRPAPPAPSRSVNFTLFRSWHAATAGVVVAVFVLWLLFLDITPGSGARNAVSFQLSSGWVLLFLILLVMLYTLRKHTHRSGLSPELSRQITVEQLERAYSSLAALRHRILVGQLTSKAQAKREAKRILKEQGAAHTLRVRFEDNPHPEVRFRLQTSWRFPLGRVAQWMHVHLFYGLAAAILLWLHGGGVTASLMGVLLYGLGILVIVTGLAGIGGWALGPTGLTRRERDIPFYKAVVFAEHYARKVKDAQENDEPQTLDLRILREQGRRVQKHKESLQRYHFLLNVWRLVHVPAAILLMAVVVIHILTVWWY